MKPLKNLVSISSMTGIITALEKLRLSGAQIVRLQKILLGVGTQHLIAEGGYYPQENFYQLSKMLRYHHLKDMMTDIQNSGQFIIGMNRQNTAIQWFASPLFMSLDMVKNHLENRPENTENILSDDAELGGLFSSNVTSKVAGKVAGLPPAPPSIFMTLTGKIIPPGRLASVPTDAKPTAEKRTLSNAEKDVEYNRWLHTLDSEDLQLLFDSIRSHIVETYHCTEEEARSVFRYLMTHTLREHFRMQDAFFRTKDDGRKAWLINVLSCSTSDRRLREAYTSYRRVQHKRSAQQHQQRDATARLNKPLSPYEWTDPEDGHRYYDDRLNGLTHIPDNVPPRPTENAYLSQDTWKQEQP